MKIGHKIYSWLICLFIILQTSAALYSKVDDIIELTSNNFDTLVVKSDEVWLVQFYAPWCPFCQNLVLEYIKAAAILKGIIKVGVVNADDCRELGSIYQVRALPSIKIFGVDKQKPEDFTGPKNAKDIIKAAWKAAKDTMLSRLEPNDQHRFYKNSNNVVELTDSTFDDLVLRSQQLWMVLFFAPWCGYCHSLEPHWEEAAKQLKGKIHFGALDSAKNKRKSIEYEIKGYPSIKLFKFSSAPMEYTGARNTEDIVDWGRKKYEETLPIPEIHQLVNEKMLINECNEKELGVVIFLPSILDCQSTCRNYYLAALKNLAARFKLNNWCWIWSEANAQPKVEELLGVGVSGYPALAVVDHHSKNYYMFYGSFINENIYDFLIDIYEKKGRRQPIGTDSLPEIKDVLPWDGKDKIIAQQEL